MGGKLMTMPSGILGAILTNTAAKLIMHFIPKIRFYSKHRQTHATVFTIFIVTYYCMGLLVMNRQRKHIATLQNIPADFSPKWLLYYSKELRTQMIMYNIIPFVKPILKVMWGLGCCCRHRKTFKINKAQNSEFAYERRYASILTTTFICFNYGFAVPSLFVTAAAVFTTEYVLDKLLITYYYKERVENNDFLNRSTLRVLKYGIVFFFVYWGTGPDIKLLCDQQSGKLHLVHERGFGLQRTLCGTQSLNVRRNDNLRTLPILRLLRRQEESTLTGVWKVFGPSQ
jgi:hypothetical protein